MITLIQDRIRWERDDVRVMSKIFGSEHAIIPKKKKQRYREIPAVMSVLKLADRLGGLLSPQAERALRDAKREHSRIEKKKRWTDASIDEPFARKYFRHQRADLGLMYSEERSGWLIASEAGVGKTLPVIRYAKHVGAERIMLVVPNVAKEQWKDEIHRWGSKYDKVIIINGTVRHQMKQIARAKRGWVITHPESLLYARDAWLDGHWHMAIIDEAHVFGNRRTQRADTLHDLDAQHRIAVTAHPYANSTAELFSILKFLYPDQYTSFWRWAGMHIEIEEGPWGGLDLNSPRRPKLLQWEIAPFTIRRLWKDVWKNLPPITRVTCSVYLNAKARREYERLRKEFFARLSSYDGSKNILAIPSDLARVTRLRQYLIDPDILGSNVPSAKYPAVLEKMEELKGRTPVIFTMFRESAVRLQSYLRRKKKRVAIISGGMQKKVRGIQRKFLRGQFDAVIIVTKAGGTSLNFGKYGVIFNLDGPWNQRDIEQTEGRVRRPEEGTGKLVPCTSYSFIVHDSYEERMAKMRRDKHEDFSKIFTVAQARELFEDTS